MMTEPRSNLTNKCLEYFKSCRVELLDVTKFGYKTGSRKRLFGLNLPCNYQYKFEKGGIIKTGNKERYNEILINKKVLRIKVTTKSLNKEILNKEKFSVAKKRKSILKLSNNSVSFSKTVRFNERIYVTSIFPLNNCDSCSEDEVVSKFSFKILDNITSCKTDTFFNGASVVRAKKSNIYNGNTSGSDPNMDFEGGTPKKKRGRPRKINPDPPFNPSASKKKTYTLAKKIEQPLLTETGEPRRKRGRPRKKFVFGFHSIVSDIKTVILPSDLWSAHVSVSSKKSQVCFTRVVQALSSTVPVECDRSIQFNSSINYLLKIDNRDVELVAAPKTVNSLKDIETLLQIVHDININDPILNYLQR